MPGPIQYRNTGDIIPAEDHNVIGSYLEEGTYRVNTLRLEVQGSEVIDINHNGSFVGSLTASSIVSDDWSDVSITESQVSDLGDYIPQGQLPLGSIPSISADDLSDVDASSPSEFDVLQYDGTNYVSSLSTDYKLVYNNSGGTIGAGSLVSINDSFGAVAAIEVADKDTDVNVAGITIESISNGTTGLIQLQGELEDSFVNTNGISAGATLYLGDGGLFTDTRPSSGNIVRIGKAGVIAPSNGTLLLNMPADNIDEGDITGLGDGDYYISQGALPYGSLTTALPQGVLPVGSVPDLTSSYIPQGVIASGSVSEASVTQHESALTITESQISDLSHYSSSDFDIDFSSKSTTDLSEGTNLYYTDSRVTSVITGSSLVGSGDNISLLNNDSGYITDYTVTEADVTQHEAAIDHDALTNFVANEHIDWTNASEDLLTSGSITASDGSFTGSLYGYGGDLTGVEASPAGPSNSVQFNDGGTFAGSADLTFSYPFAGRPALYIGQYEVVSSVWIPNFSIQSINSLERLFINSDSDGIFMSFDGTATGERKIVSFQPLNLNDNPITDVEDPTNAQDAATKNYVGSYAMGVVVDDTGSATRPDFSVVHWIGSTEPSNSLDNDLWTDTT